jgi:hypothetical protein
MLCLKCDVVKLAIVITLEARSMRRPKILLQQESQADWSSAQSPWHPLSHCGQAVQACLVQGGLYKLQLGIIR